MPLIDLSRPALVVADVVAWGSISALAGYLAHRRPATRLARDGPVTRLRGWEVGGQVYERRLRVTRWKDRLPEAGGLFAGGFSKRSVRRADLDRYLVETRRAELTHWWILATVPLFALWNPWWLWLAMLAYGVVANLPCIVIQRYNRGRVLRILARRARRPGA